MCSYWNQSSKQDRVDDWSELRSAQFFAAHLLRKVRTFLAEDREWAGRAHRSHWQEYLPGWSERESRRTVSIWIAIAALAGSMPVRRKLGIQRGRKEC